MPITATPRGWQLITLSSFPVDRSHRTIWPISWPTSNRVLSWLAAIAVTAPFSDPDVTVPNSMLGFWLGSYTSTKPRPVPIAMISWTQITVGMPTSRWVDGDAMCCDILVSSTLRSTFPCLLRRFSIWVTFTAGALIETDDVEGTFVRSTRAPSDPCDPPRPCRPSSAATEASDVAELPEPTRARGSPPPPGASTDADAAPLAAEALAAVDVRSASARSTSAPSCAADCFLLCAAPWTAASASFTSASSSTSERSSSDSSMIEARVMLLLSVSVNAWATIWSTSSSSSSGDPTPAPDIDIVR
eukprot:m.361877 g.361877  ORF g.361877 m.361877 type:complete len:302 (+) comp28057_c2_seq7:3619-4524(+)